MKIIDVLVIIALVLAVILTIILDNRFIELSKKVTHGAAFELDGRILRCNDIISNEASDKKVRGR